MADPTFGGVGPTGAAIDFVNQGWDYFENKASTFTDKVLQLVDALQFVPQVQPVVFHTDFPDVTGLVAFTAPPRPTLPDIAYQPVSIPDAPELALPPEPAFTAAPAFDVAEPLPVSLPTQPGAFSVAAPGPAPELTVLTLPEAPDLSLPEFPQFLTIAIPELPATSMPTFNAASPGDAPLPPSLSGIDFAETPYTREVLNDITPWVRKALAGGTGLSAAVEGAIFQRARRRLDRVTRKSRQQVADEFSGRGFTEPPGAFAARMAEVVQENVDAGLELDSTITIQFHETEIKNIQFAVTQGIALEQLLIGQHSQIMDRSLQAAKLLLDARVAIHNAEVNSYNAKIAKFRADADVFKARIDGEVAKLEGYRAQVEGQKAIADINKAAADAYDSQVRGVLGMVEIYKGQIAAVSAQADIDKSRIEAHRATIEGYAEQVRAYDSRWAGYKTAVEAKEAGFRSYEVGTRAWVARMDGWHRGEEIKSARYETSLRASTLKLDGFRTKIQGALANLQGEVARINALGTKADALARMYGADAQVEVARSDANTRKFDSTVAYHTARVSAEANEAQIKIQDAARVLTAQVTAIGGATNAMAQLSASAMAAVNFSAGVSGSGSEGTSFGYSLSKGLGWNWSGETSQNDNPPLF